MRPILKTNHRFNTVSKSFKLLLFGALSLATVVPNLRADYPSEVLADGPLFYFRLNESVTTPVYDIATNSGSLGAAGNGLYSGATHPVAGAIVSQPGDKAVSFPGAGNMAVPFQAGLNVPGPFTFEFWAKPTAAASGCVASSIKLGNSGWPFYNSPLVAGQWSFRTIDSGSVNRNSSGGTVTPGVWQHIAGVWDGTQNLLYVNGVQVANNTAATSFLPNSDATLPLTLGIRSDNSFQSDGSIDEAAYYTTALSAAKILAHYQNGTNASPGTPYPTLIASDGAVGYWRLNEPAPVFPTATNSGTLGAAVNGIYQGVATNFPGPAPVTYAGFSAGNNAASFDGTNGFVRFPPSGTLTNSSLASVTEATFLCWVKRNGAQGGYKGVLACRPLSTGLYINTDDTLNYSWNDAGNTWGYDSMLIPPDGEWTMAAVVVKPDAATFYMGSISGGWATAVNTVTHAAGNFTTGPFAIGQDIGIGGRFFNGGIDEAAIFNRALTSGRLQSFFYTAIGSNSPPVMVTDPPTLTPSGTVYSTTTFQLTADVAGALPMRFQWRTNGTLLPGATSYIYTRSNASTNDTANYDVVITNAYGSVTSMVVTVTVNPAVPPTLTQQPASRSVYAGGTASFTVAATGTTPITYQWQHASTNLPGATNATLIITNCGAPQTGSYAVGVSNVAGGVLSSTATLTLRTPLVGSYEAALVADGPVSYWRLGETSGTIAFDMMGGHDGTYSANVTHGSGALNGDGDGSAGFNGTDAFVGTGAGLLNGVTQFTLAGWVRRGGAQANRTGLYGQNDNVEFGYISDQTIECWDDVVGSAVDVPNPLADGVWGFVVVTSDGTTRTLYVNGQVLGTGTARTASKTNSFGFNIGGGGVFDNPNVNGNWFLGDIDEVALFNKALTAGQISTLYSIGQYGTTTPPFVTLNPASTTQAVGTTVTLTAGIGGSLPLTYQWKKNGVNIPGATSQTLTFNSVFFTDSANYTLYATNSLGFTNTATATLAVMPQPSYANETNNLVLHLRFDNNYLDTSGRTNDASAPATSPGFVTGKLGQAVNINTTPGVNYLTVSDLNGDLQFDVTNSFTVALWLKYSAAFNDDPIIGNAVNSTYQTGWVLTEDGGRFEWTAVGPSPNGGSVIADPVSGTSPLINNGAWHHVAVAFDRAAGRAASYVDGARVATHSLSGLGTLITGQTLTIGQDPSGNYGTANFNLDDLGIWRRALTDYEMLSVYNAGQNGASFDTYGPVRVGINFVGGSNYISWQAGTLLEATNVTGPYTPVGGASAPLYVTTPSVKQKFYRVLQ